VALCTFVAGYLECGVMLSILLNQKYQRINMEEYQFDKKKYSKAGRIVSMLGIIIMLLSTSLMIYFNTQKENDFEDTFERLRTVRDSLKMIQDTLDKVKVSMKLDEIESYAVPLDQNVPHHSYNITIRIKDPMLIPKLKSVEYYFNHYTFHPKLKTSTDSNSQFAVTYRGWGALFNVPVYLHYKDNSKVDTINYKMYTDIRIRLSPLQ
jgi:hypothetical protein